MRKVINEEIGNYICEQYSNHVHPKDIAEVLNISETTVIRYLKSVDLYSPELHQSYYKKNKTVKVKWTADEIAFLNNNYNKLSAQDLFEYFNRRHSKKAISSKAIYLGLTYDKKWTQDEEEILLKYYPLVSFDEIMKLLPDRTKNSIICHAMRLNVKGKYYIEENYSEEQKQYISDNSWIKSDTEIAVELNKPVSGVQEQRRKLGIYYLNKDYSNYNEFQDLFRGHIGEWKRKSCEACNYKCVLTGSKDFAVHHLYGFNLIVIETFRLLEQNNLLKSYHLKDYTTKELDYIIDIFKKVHDSYPLGVCVDKKIHDLFHQIYGKGGNTENQWIQFVRDYKNDEIIK